MKRELTIYFDGPLPRKNKVHAPGKDSLGILHIYKRKEIKDIQERLAWTAFVALRDELGGDPLEGMVDIEFIFRFAHNDSDSDGPVSLMIDALKGVVFGDDKMVLKHSARIDLGSKWLIDRAIITIRETGIKDRSDPIITEAATKYL